MNHNEKLAELARKVILHTGMFDEQGRQLDDTAIAARYELRQQWLAEIATLYFPPDKSPIPYDEKKRAVDLAMRFLGILSAGLPDDRLRKGFWATLAEIANSESQAY